MSEWKDIKTAPSLDRVMVAGWQEAAGSTKGYWWLYEDITDEDGVPMEHPTALRWQPLPEVPNHPPAKAEKEDCLRRYARALAVVKEYGSTTPTDKRTETK